MAVAAADESGLSGTTRGGVEFQQPDRPNSNPSEMPQTQEGKEHVIAILPVGDERRHMSEPQSE
jgi:hypothetical protein